MSETPTTRARTAPRGEEGVRLTRQPVCGNSKCCTSTSIAGYLTHGWGRLDDHGHWQFECPEQDGKHREQDEALCASLGYKNGELA